MICICDYRTPNDVLDSLSGRGFETVQLPPDPSLPEPVNGHADLLVFILDQYLITRRSYYGIAKKEIDLICETAILNLSLSDEKSGTKYPEDCGLCAAVSGDKIIYRKASADGEILRLAEDLGYKLLNVPQGYSKCSCAILADGAIITADRGIAKVTQNAEIDTLIITPGQVVLPGYNLGFIGGATGLCGNTLYFCGDLKTHPDFERIRDFAEAHGCETVSLSDEKLYDVGSLMFV